MNKQGEHGIEWTDYTLNQMTGCLNHVNGLCKGGGSPCYAYKIASRFKERYLVNEHVSLINVQAVYDDSIGIEIARRRRDPFYPRIWEERFKPLKGYPEGTKIFLDDMSDWMGIGIPDSWKRQTIEFIKAHPQYIFQTLTKQPQELPKWEFPENCWVGVTATSNYLFDIATEAFVKIQAKVKFLSVEPLLEKMYWPITNDLHLIDWLIIGSQTKPYKPPKIEWVQEIVRAADKANIRVFLKENLRPLLENDPLNRLYWANVHDDERGHERADDELRQEFPKC